MPRPNVSAVEGRPKIGSASASSPSAPMAIMVWKNRPAFSSSVIWERRFSTRLVMGRLALR